MKYIEILGTGRAAPKDIVTNDEISNHIDTSNEWILSRTGIEERRICGEENSLDLAVTACNHALQNSNINPKDIDAIIVATITGDMITPSMACMVQKEIGAINATAFDINGACTGFIFGLSIGESLITSGKAGKVLVLGIEMLSKVIDWKDRSTCVLFGDGAGCAILGQGTKGIKAIYTKSYGDLGHNIQIGGLAAKKVFAHKPFKENNHNIYMNGREVFKFATFVIIDAVEKVLKESDLTIEKIDLIIPHQANKRIIEFASKKMGVDLEKFYINLDKYGNTSSASIPMALDEAIERKIIKEGQRVILVGFGGGLTAGAVLVEF